MTPQEKELIQNVATKLKKSPDKAKDSEADQLINQEIGSQQDAIYKLTQAVLVQEMALKEMKQKNEYLEKCAKHHKTEANRGALSKIMGGNRPAPQPPQSAHQPSAFGSFMQTAASVAVGMVAGNMISNALFNDDQNTNTTAAADTPAETDIDDPVNDASDTSGGFLDDPSNSFASDYTEPTGGFGDAGFSDNGPGFGDSGFSDGSSGFGDSGFGNAGFEDNSFANNALDDSSFSHGDDSFFGGGNDFGDFGDDA